MSDTPTKSAESYAGANASAFGSAVAVLVVMTYHLKGIDFPAGYEAALACIISTLCAYGRAFLSKVIGVSLP
jgi:hypothetical protein